MLNKSSFCAKISKRWKQIPSFTMKRFKTYPKWNSMWLFKSPASRTDVTERKKIKKETPNRLQLKFSMLKKDCYNQLCVMMTDDLGPLSDCGCCRLPWQRCSPVGRTANPEISAEVWRHPKLCSSPLLSPPWSAVHSNAKTCWKDKLCPPTHKSGGQLDQTRQVKGGGGGCS